MTLDALTSMFRWVKRKAGFSRPGSVHTLRQYADSQNYADSLLRFSTYMRVSLPCSPCRVGIIRPSSPGRPASAGKGGVALSPYRSTIPAQWICSRGFFRGHRQPASKGSLIAPRKKALTFKRFMEVGRVSLVAVFDKGLPPGPRIEGQHRAGVCLQSSAFTRYAQLFQGFKTVYRPPG